VRTRRLVLLALVSLFVFAPQGTALRALSKGDYQTGFTHWRSADGGFSGWTLTGVSRAAGGAVQLDRATAVSETDPYGAGGYYGKNFYNGGAYLVGEAVSPIVPLTIPVQEAIASWNADTPAGTWIETLVSASDGTRSTKWYNLGVWASGTSPIERHSVSAQGDADGSVAVDTLVLDKKFVATALQLKIRLFAAAGVTATPTLRNVGLTFSATRPKKVTATSGSVAATLSVPECSQMVYPDGGDVWCSPTSTSMVLGFWTNDTGPCEPRVRAAVAGVFDWKYNGDGNWPFNTAYAAAAGLEAYVVRFSSMAELEPWVKAGVPVVISYAWNKDLTGAPIPSSNGHLAVLVGFDGAGNPVVNDPAAASDGDVQRTYLRSELETLWLTSSGGTTYLIFPAGRPVPIL
jgi:hypothetical protein